MKKEKELSNSNEIKLYLHCGLCLDELKDLDLDLSPQEYQKIQVGWTEGGIQVWCNRHDCNLVNIDFEGQTHLANTTREKKEEELN